MQSSTHSNRSCAPPIPGRNAGAGNQSRRAIAEQIPVLLAFGVLRRPTSGENAGAGRCHSLPVKGLVWPEAARLNVGLDRFIGAAGTAGQSCVLVENIIFRGTVTGRSAHDAAIDQEADIFTTQTRLSQAPRFCRPWVMESVSYDMYAP